MIVYLYCGEVSSSSLVSVRLSASSCLVIMSDSSCVSVLALFSCLIAESFSSEVIDCPKLSLLRLIILDISLIPFITLSRIYAAVKLD